MIIMPLKIINETSLIFGAFSFHTTVFPLERLLRLRPSARAHSGVRRAPRRHWRLGRVLLPLLPGHDLPAAVQPHHLRRQGVRLLLSRGPHLHHLHVHQRATEVIQLLIFFCYSEQNTRYSAGATLTTTTCSTPGPTTSTRTGSRSTSAWIPTRGSGWRSSSGSPSQCSSCSSSHTWSQRQFPGIF